MMIPFCCEMFVVFPCYMLMEESTAKEIVKCIAFSFRIGLVILIVIRIYLLHFDFQYTKIWNSKTWSNFINASYVDCNFYVKNRNKFGRASYLLTRIVIPILVLIVVIQIVITNIAMKSFDDIKMTVNDPFYQMIIFAVDFAVCALVGFWYWNKFPKIGDTLHIREELQISSILFMVIGVWLVAGGIWSSVFLSGDTTLPRQILVIGLQFLYTTGVMILVIYPKWRMHKKSSHEMMAVLTSTHDAGYSYAEWTSVIDTDEGYCEFAQFLNMEFSIENLLFVTEYAQLKKAMLEHEELKQSMENNELTWNLNLPQSAPQSLIVKGFSMEDSNCVFTAIQKLYVKYIDSTQAMLAVNISYKVRRELDKAMYNCAVGKDSTNHNVVECDRLMPLLERAVESICHLMKDSYGRYRRTDSFGELVKAKSTSI